MLRPFGMFRRWVGDEVRPIKSDGAHPELCEWQVQLRLDLVSGPLSEGFWMFYFLNWFSFKGFLWTSRIDERNCRKVFSWKHLPEIPGGADEVLYFLAGNFQKSQVTHIFQRLIKPPKKPWKVWREKNRKDGGFVGAPRAFGELLSPPSFVFWVIFSHFWP